MSKGIVLSGTRPTGHLHFGNYFGALENWVRLQEDYDCRFFIADWHALTTGYENTEDMKQNIGQVAVDFLSVGLNPDKAVLFLQSKVPEHAVLHLLFSMSTPLSWLYRCPTYKEQLQQMKDKNITTYGFLGYPCLQAADILIYKAGYVPVGEDQLPHLELTREMARRFNFLYKEIFPEPQAILTKSKVLPGLDGRKMSKSYGNTVNLSDTPDIINEKVKTMVTDPERIRKTDPGHPDVCSVFAFHKIFNDKEENNIGQCCKAGIIGCVACKKNLANKINEYMAPMHERRKEIIEKPKMVREVIEEGSKKAQIEARKTLDEVKQAMNLDF